MLFATWVTALNILVFAALVAAVIYLFVLIVRALKKYIGSKEMREEKQAVKRTLGETLKAHRTRCQMTQEFVAEAFGRDPPDRIQMGKRQRRPEHHKLAGPGQAVRSGGGGAVAGNRSQRRVKRTM